MAGNYIPYGRKDYLNLSGGTVTGNTAILAAFTATTYYSGSTLLEDIIYNIADGAGDILYLQNGLNTYTGGTSGSPSINISGASLDNIFVSGNSVFTNITGGTFYSGSTPLTTIINNIASSYSGASGPHTYIQNGLNTYTGGTDSLPTVNISGASLDNIFVSGSSRFNTLSGGTISGNTFFSGSTPLTTIINTIASSYSGAAGPHTYIQKGLNTYTGGTDSLPTINISGASLDNIFVSGSSRFNTLTGGTISGGTFFSGSTPLSTIINSIAAQYSGNTNVQPGSNITTGGTALNPIVSVAASPSFNNLTFSGSVTGTSLSGTNNRVVEVNSGGTFSATRQIIGAYITSGGTIANILENTINWDINGVFIGTGITGTYMGQKHYNTNYFFEAVDDDFWIRLIRG